MDEETKKAMEEDEKRETEALYKIGESLVEDGQYERAIFYFEEVVEDDPKHVEAYFQLGYCYFMLKEFNEAAEAFKKALRFAPKYPDAHYWLGVAYLMLGDTSTALKEQKVLQTLDRKLAEKLLEMIQEGEEV